MTNSNNNLQIITHTLIGFLSFWLGYKYGGLPFIILMAPYVCYMVLKKDAKYFPALVFHAASSTSIIVVICFSIIYVCISNYKQLDRMVKTVFWILISMMPIFLVLLFQSMAFLGESIGAATAHISLYLSLFFFFYGIILRKSINIDIIRILIVFIFIAYFVKWSRVSEHAIFLAFSIVYLIFLKKPVPQILKILAPIVIIAGLLVNSFLTSSFHNLLIVAYSVLLIWAYYSNHSKILSISTGIIPYIFIIFMYVYGINNYKDMIIDDTVTEIDFSSYSKLKDRATYKIFEDRAPFWSGAMNQIIEFHSLLPVYDMPNFTAEHSDGREGEVSFGSHTTFIEFLRIYGILPGLILIGVHIYLTIIGRKYLFSKNVRPIYLCFFITSFSVIINICFAGVFHLMSEFALMSWGVLGMGYEASKGQIKVTTKN